MVRNSDSWLPVIPDYRPKVAHIVRNRWLHYSGMSGTHKPEQVAGLERNTQHACQNTVFQKMIPIIHEKPCLHTGKKYFVKNEIFSPVFYIHLSSREKEENMLTRNRNFKRGGIYHIFNRTVSNTVMCLDDEDFTLFALKLLDYAKLLKIKILSWSLIPNHFHFMCVQTGTHTPGKLVERMLKSFVKIYNHKYGRRGPMFESRYKCKEVNSKSYFNTLMAYILTNAVHHNLVQKPEKWPYSNYSSYQKGNAPHPEYLVPALKIKERFCFFIKHYLKRKKRMTLMCACE